VTSWPAEETRIGDTIAMTVMLHSIESPSPNRMMSPPVQIGAQLEGKPANATGISV
jgi:hypothetical protein